MSPFSKNVYYCVSLCDGATILKLLEVEHPAAKVLCELADLQDKEVGEGTASMIIIYSELSKIYLYLICILYIYYILL
uniref:Uncharacterized protein n=1 Tax=Oryctolagus cuniculus TaxID=9986 RepID=A0A5F9D281_RABIT